MTRLATLLERARVFALSAYLNIFCKEIFKYFVRKIYTHIKWHHLAVQMIIKKGLKLGLKLAHTFRGFGRLWGTCCGMGTLHE